MAHEVYIMLNKELMIYTSIFNNQTVGFLKT